MKKLNLILFLLLIANTQIRSMDNINQCPEVCDPYNSLTTLLLGSSTIALGTIIDKCGCELNSMPWQTIGFVIASEGLWSIVKLMAICYEEPPYFWMTNQK